MPRTAWRRAAACRATRRRTSRRREMARDQGREPRAAVAEGGLDETPRARQHRAAAPHVIRLAALGPHLEPHSAVRDRDLLFLIRTERAATFAALSAARARPQSASARSL